MRSMHRVLAVPSKALQRPCGKLRRPCWTVPISRSACTAPSPLPAGLFLAFALVLDWWLFIAALGVDECQVVFRVKRVPMSGLLSRCVQGDVNATIVGEDHNPQII